MFKLSVITINYNNAIGLRKTIESVILQNFHDYEYIVIDGLSFDGSVEIIKEYSNRITYWISEPDKGIYNAMNKGVLRSSGEYIHFLNSGDWLVDENVYSQVFAHSLNADIIYGNRFQVYANKTILNKGFQTSDFTFKDAFQGCIFHTCSFSKRTLFDKFGLFDEEFKIISDYIFYLKAIGLSDSTVKYVDVNISYFDMNGISQNIQNKEIQLNEIVRAKQKYLPPRLVADYDLFLDYQRIFSKIKLYKVSWFLFRALNWCILKYEATFKK